MSKTIVIDPKGFFHEAVEDAFAQRKLQTFPLVRQYIANLLEHYMITDHLFDASNDSGKKRYPTLAEMYLTATNTETGVRIDLLKKLGDTSLYVSGFFGESLQRKIVDIDYYVNMGGMAYGSLSGFVKEDTYRKVYEEFSTRFVEYVDVLTLLSQKMMVQSDENLLRLYDNYLRTGSELAKDTLIEKGINPVPKNTKAFSQ